MHRLFERAHGTRLAVNGVTALVAWVALTAVNQTVDPLMSYYLAVAAMYATAMFGMTILVGLSGQVSLGNGALMAVGGYVFALTSLHWRTVPIIGTPRSAVSSMIFAGLGGIVFGLLIGGLAARLRGPYLAGLTLGLAVGLPAVANRFTSVFGGENGLMLQVPYPRGGYPTTTVEVDESDSGTGGTGDEPVYEELPDELFIQDDSGLSDEDVLSEDDFTSDEGFTVDGGEGTGGLSDEDVLSEDDFTSDEGFTVDGGEGSGGLSDEDVLSEEDFATDDGFVIDDSGTASEDPLAPIEPTDDVVGDDFVVEDVVVEDIIPGEGDAAGGLDPNFVIEQWQASMAIAVACIVGFVALNLIRGRQGRVWRAVRDDPVAAAVAGISPAGSKVSAFVISSFFAALAGAAFVQILSYVGPGAFSLGLSLSLLVGIVLGGRNSLVGALIGAVILVWLPEFVLGLSGDRGWGDQVTNNAPNLIYGLLVVAVVLAAPGGLVGTVQSVGRKLVRKPQKNKNLA